MKPLAPGRGSTSTCCDQTRDSFSASTRVNTAGAAPAEYGAVIFTTLDGYACASADEVVIDPAAIKTSSRVSEIAFMFDRGGPATGRPEGSANVPHRPGPTEAAPPPAVPT